jgi:hypothetical protein
MGGEYFARPQNSIFLDELTEGPEGSHLTHLACFLVTYG